MNKFYREKNALKIKDAKVINPSQDELVVLLQNKLYEKIEHIKVINNKKMREKYLKNKNKCIDSLTMPEFEVKKLLTERVCVDIFELVISLSGLENSPLKSNSISNATTDASIAKQMEMALNNTNAGYLNTIFSLLLNLCNNYNFSIEDISKKQKVIEDTEGSFLNGKIVIYDK